MAGAVLALAAGAGLVGAGLAWGPARDGTDPAAITRGARLYAAACADCHGARLAGPAVRTESGSGLAAIAPPLDATGHAWRHTDADLAAIIAHGTEGTGGPGGTPGMPAFAGRLDRSEIAAVLTFVKSHWPAGLRAYQAALNPGGEEALAGLLRDPAWTLPGQCRSPPGASDGP
ncbi:MAG TPA: cytochrome c [Crenalkalicoccus sp.]|nr:cytochrome c [Crenalkalicoccus sp.]